MKATATIHDLRFRAADFPSLTDALEYAARGVTGMNFYSGRGELRCVLPYAELRRQARDLARRLLGLGTQPGARAALIAETDADFLRFFFACQYAGLVPVPLPISVNLGSHRAYVNHLRGLLIDCQGPSQGDSNRKHLGVDSSVRQHLIQASTGFLQRNHRFWLLQRNRVHGHDR